MRQNPPHVAIVGAGPAGLMAAESLSRRGAAVTVYDGMRAPGRKFLIAGRGGLNLTHSEDFATFLTRYGDAADWLQPYLSAFPPTAVRTWADGLGAETFIGTSGRVFPKAMRATPLLRAWLKRLQAQGVRFALSHAWTGWKGEALSFATGTGEETVDADATVLALGGASWPRLGSTGAWTAILQARGVAISPLRPANCGFLVDWSPRFRDFAGEPLKNIALTFAGQTVRGEAQVTTYGLEGGTVYALSRDLRETIAAEGTAQPVFDLRPDLSLEAVAAKLADAKRGQSQANILRKSLHLSPVAINLMREAHGIHLPTPPDALAACVKAVPLRLTAAAPIDRAISSAGGIKRAAVTETLELSALPGVFAAGEMLDWEAPTGGYLLSACLATAIAAAEGAAKRLDLA